MSRPADQNEHLHPLVVSGLMRELLADLLDDAAQLLRRGPAADAQALALHLATLEGPHRAAWLKMAPLACRFAVRPAARRMVATLTRPAPLQKTPVPQVPPVGEVVPKTHVRKWP